jgi:hypothetical protein
MTIVAKMTDEEAEAVDKYYTENTIMRVKLYYGFFRAIFQAII